MVLTYYVDSRTVEAVHSAMGVALDDGGLRGGVHGEEGERRRKRRTSGTMVEEEIEEDERMDQEQGAIY